MEQISGGYEGMRNLGVFAALALSWITASCAERMVSQTVIPEPVRAPQAGPKPRLSSVEARRQAETIAEDARKRSAIRPRRVSPSASFKIEQPPEPQTPLQQELQQPQATPTGRAAVAVPPPTTEPDASNFPYAALMPPPPEPAEPTFPSVPLTVELPPSSEPAAPVLPEMPMEAAMPLLPEPAKPSFPVAVLMPPPPEPAEPSLPSQEEATAENAVSIPFPDLSAPLSMHPRFDWEEVTGSFDIPHSPLSEVFEARPERQVPSLIRNPWPLL
jgi:hypothetical protein